LKLFSKKMIASLQRERERILRNLAGVRTMTRLPGALVVIDPRRERNAVHEASILGIPVVALLDTDADPDLIDIPIPGNDDALRSIQLITHVLTRSLEEGAILAGETAKAQEQAAEAATQAKAQADTAPM
jgi:small subunit ribosomal protein S2